MTGAKILGEWGGMDRLGRNGQIGDGWTDWGGMNRLERDGHVGQGWTDWGDMAD